MALTSWTEDRVTTLKTLWEKGWTCKQIAAELGGVTRNGVIGKVHRLNIASSAPEKAYAKPRSVQEAEARKQKRLEQRREGRRNGGPMFTYNRPVRPAMCEPVTPQGISLMDIEPHHCRWPYGEGPYTFCGHTKFHSSYCASHYFESIGPGTASERAADRVSA